jgi:hypothetical protein
MNQAAVVWGWRQELSSTDPCTTDCRTLDLNHQRRVDVAFLIGLRPADGDQKVFRALLAPGRSHGPGRHPGRPAENCRASRRRDMDRRRVRSNQCHCHALREAVPRDRQHNSVTETAADAVSAQCESLASALGAGHLRPAP